MSKSESGGGVSRGKGSGAEAMSLGERWSRRSHWSCEGPDTGVGYGAGWAGVRIPSTRNKTKRELK
ncbi:MAG: hypothetical protein ACO363_09205, partial [Balneolaceae bacterium]